MVGFERPERPHEWERITGAGLRGLSSAHKGGGGGRGTQVIGNVQRNVLILLPYF